MMRHEQRDEDHRDALWIAGKHEMSLMDARNLPGSVDSAAATHEAWVQLRKDIFAALNKRATYCDVCGCSCPCCKDKPSSMMIEIAREKCRQYWNGRAVGEAEFRAIMGFIHDCLEVRGLVEKPHA